MSLAGSFLDVHIFQKSQVGDAQWMRSPMADQGTTLLVHRLPTLMLYWLQSPWGEDRDEAHEGVHSHGIGGIGCTWTHSGLRWSNLGDLCPNAAAGPASLCENLDVTCVVLRPTNLLNLIKTTKILLACQTRMTRPRR